MNKLVQKDQEILWHPYTSLIPDDLPILIDSAKGAYLYSSDGRKILDAVSSWWVNLHGHSNEYIADAISNQARKLEHVIFAGFTHSPAILLAERLISILPGDQKRVFYSDNGSTAVEVALKMAIQYWYNQNIQRRKIIAIEGAFHGDTFGAMAIGGKGVFTQPFSPYLFDVEFIPFPSGNAIKDACEKFENVCQSGEVAAFIYEPLVQGAAGMRIYDQEDLNKLLNIASKYEVVKIADEVMTGFGRTGNNFASEYCDTKPDIICLSKGITGGTMPLGATTCNERIATVFTTSDHSKTFYHGHSFTANPLSCACANASMDLLLSEECQKKIKEITKAHVEFAEEIKSHPAVLKVATLGTIFSMELKSEEASGYLNSLRKKITGHFMSKDILLRPLGNVIYILPPYVIEPHDLNKIYYEIKSFLNILNK